jgi:hypothetical protein
MAKFKRFTDEDDKALNNPSALPEGVTEDDLRDANSNPMRVRPGQRQLAEESDARDANNSQLYKKLSESMAQHQEPTPAFAAQLRSTVNAFKAAPAGPEKEKHRVAAWSMVEGIKRDTVRKESGPTADDPTRGGRTTKKTFVHGQELPCVNGRCNNTVPYDSPKSERDAEKAGGPRASDVTCAEGGCDIPAAVAPRPAER